MSDPLAEATQYMSELFFKQLDEACWVAFVGGRFGVLVTTRPGGWKIELSPKVPHGQIHERRER